MDPLAQTQLLSLMNISRGNPDIAIGVIDGPIDVDHPAFRGSRIRAVKDSQLIACKKASDIACAHGTSVTGILSAKRGLSAPAICPDCEIILNPIFRKEGSTVNNNNIILPSTTSEELSNAIIETVDAGAQVINLSLGISASSLTVYDKLQQAYDYAFQRDAIVVVAAGNQGNIGNISLINHQWLIPVAACDENGRLHPMSNFGPSIANRGLMGPGVNITTTYPGAKYVKTSGTSFAAPFVTGAAALLWSMFPKATASEIVYAIRKSVSIGRARTITPPLLDAEQAWKLLENSSGKR
jgi:subtilisin family serine protease